MTALKRIFECDSRQKASGTTPPPKNGSAPRGKPDRRAERRNDAAALRLASFPRGIRQR